MNQYHSKFEEQKYLVLISPQLLKVLSDYLWFKHRQSGYKHNKNKTFMN